MNPELKEPMLLLVDITLALASLALAYASLRIPAPESPDAYQGQRRRIILFMAFGLVLALIWARLAAPDVAIAEAAIGAGFAGALLLTALRDKRPPSSQPIPSPVRILITALCAGLGALLFAALWIWIDHQALSAGRNGLGSDIAALIPETGVTNPVTAVLLSFRAYDTLLELVVLLAAAIAIASLGQSRPTPERAGEVLRGLAHWLVPALIVIAGYLLWVGASAPGGAFQAGALLAAAGVIIHLSGGKRGGLPTPALQAWLSVSGIGVFLLVGIGTLVAGGSFLHYREDQASALILIIEIFATLSIGTLLVQAYLGGLARGSGWRQTAPRPAANKGEKA